MNTSDKHAGSSAKVLISGVLLLTGSVLALSALAQSTKPKIVYVSPDPIGVNDFLKGGRKGIEVAAKALGGESRTFESSDPATRRQNVEAAARDGANVVVVLGFEFADIVPDLAPKYPKTQFLIVDLCVDKPAPNVYCAVFRQHEAAFLAGAGAALTSKTGRVAAIGALDIPLLRAFTEPFAAGARAAKPSIAVSPTLFVGGDNPFSDPVRAEQQALSALASGADRIFAGAVAGNGGIFKALRDRPGTLAIGADVNQCPQSPGVVLDNVEKRVDAVVVRAVTAMVRGKLPQLNSYGLKEGGMTLTSLGSDVATSKCEIAKYPAVIARLKLLRGQIIAGTIKVADPLNPGK